MIKKIERSKVEKKKEKKEGLVRGKEKGMERRNQEKVLFCRLSRQI